MELTMAYAGAFFTAKSSKTTSTQSWLGVWIDAWSLGMEASSVISLRVLKIAAGGAAADAEARRMICENIDANLTLQVEAFNGGLGISPLGATAKTLKHYRQKVRANQRRLAASY
jgi:hypothetical protein